MKSKRIKKPNETIQVKSQSQEEIKNELRLEVKREIDLAIQQLKPSQEVINKIEKLPVKKKKKYLRKILLTFAKGAAVTAGVVTAGAVIYNVAGKKFIKQEINSTARTLQNQLTGIQNGVSESTANAIEDLKPQINEIVNQAARQAVISAADQAEKEKGKIASLAQATTAGAVKGARQGAGGKGALGWALGGEQEQKKGGWSLNPFSSSSPSIKSVQSNPKALTSSASEIAQYRAAAKEAAEKRKTNPEKKGTRLLKQVDQGLILSTPPRQRIRTQTEAGEAALADKEGKQAKKAAQEAKKPKHTVAFELQLDDVLAAKEAQKRLAPAQGPPVTVKSIIERSTKNNPTEFDRLSDLQQSEQQKQKKLQQSAIRIQQNFRRDRARRDFKYKKAMNDYKPGLLSIAPIKGPIYNTGIREVAFGTSFITLRRFGKKKKKGLKKNLKKYLKDLNFLKNFK